MPARMKSAVTIAGTRESHNQRPNGVYASSRVFGDRNARLRLALVALLTAGCSWACTSATSGPELIPTWELVHAPPVEHLSLGRARLSYDRPLPARLVQELSPEFSLLTIRTSRDWEEVRRRLDLPAAPSFVDFSKGIVVGIVANVGESVDASWPIPIRQIRGCAGQGCLEASFGAGLYYPLLCPSYVELAYAPGVQVITRVHMSHRKFVIPLSARTK